MIVESVQRRWPQTQQNALIRRGTRRIVREIFTSAGDLRVVSTLIIGRRGGVNEEFLVIDTSRKIVTDQLIIDVREQGEGATGILFPLEHINDEVAKQGSVLGRRERATEICNTLMIEMAVTLAITPLTAPDVRSVHTHLMFEYRYRMQGRLESDTMR